MRNFACMARNLYLAKMFAKIFSFPLRVTKPEMQKVCQLDRPAGGENIAKYLPDSS